MTPLTTFVRRKPWECSWPDGEPGPHMLVCGRAIERGPYCEHHAKLAYVPDKPRRVTFFREVA